MVTSTYQHRYVMKRVFQKISQRIF